MAIRQFASFRSMDATAVLVQLTGTERFRCETCGGRPILDEIERFTTYDPPPGDDEPDRPRRGRPRKAWRQPRDLRLAQLGLAG